MKSLLKSKTFHLPDDLNATKPPEKRGVRRDHVKLMVTDRKAKSIFHDTFFHLGDYLKSGDLLILNNSRTIPAVLKANVFQRNRKVLQDVEIRLARKVSENSWDVLILDHSINEGDTLNFYNEVDAVVIERRSNSPLWNISFKCNSEKLYPFIYRYGQPIRYEYIHYPWELGYYQTTFASVPGSVELPSAGRAFSWEMLFNLQKKGIKIGYLQLHTSLSYMLEDHWPLQPQSNPEYYHVPDETMKMVEEAKLSGGRIIAVGTTVVRALETALKTNMNEGMTNLYIGPDFNLKGANGILTGFHEPEASHLDLLSAFINTHYLLDTYNQAIDRGYLWHEFGDMNLII